MKKRLLLITFSVVFIILIILFIKSKTRIKTKPSEEISVSTIQTKYNQISIPIETFGSVIYQTKNEITNLVAGTVVEKKVKEGDYVKQGQILYILKNVELEIQHAQYQNNLNSALANVELYKAKLTEDEQFAKSKLYEIENKKTEISKTTLVIKKLKEQLTTNQELNKLGGITDQAINDLKDEITLQESNLSILNKELEIMSLGFSKEDLIKAGISPSKSTDELFKQIINFNTQITQADLKVAQAELENAKKNILLIENLLNNLIIKAPLSGIIGKTNYEKGEYINQNESVVLIMDISNCYASINIQENNIYNISIGNKTSITIPSIDKTFSCTISEISPIADSTTGMFNVKAMFINNEQLAKPGMYLKCSIEKNNSDNYITVPENALINIANEDAECFIVKKNIAFKQNITIETIKNGQAYIKSGLEPDQTIIINPSNKIKEGTYVKVL